jgi:predicted AlkP superfamily phosphohydrolase/phosphomutase
MTAKVLLVGLDGATFDVIDPLLAAGRLPALAGLIARGARGNLASTVPPVTFPAWSTILTGRSPARHGLTDFTLLDVAARRLRFASARDRVGPTLPRLVSDAGGRVAAIGFPTTYPPESLNGIVVSGFDSPLPRGLASGAVAPPSALAEAEAACGRYLVSDVDETSKRGDWHRRALERLLFTADRRAALTSRLLAREPWDLFAVHFGEADTAGHHFWAIADPGSPRHVPRLAHRFGNALGLVYRALDAAVERLLRAAGPDVIVCVVSDHGMGGTSDRVVHLNRALADAGLCRLRPPSATGRALRAARGIGFALPGAAQSAIFRGLPSLPNRLEGAARFAPIDFERSVAWSEELPYFPSVRLNVPEGERDRVAREVAAALLALIDPVDGLPVFTRVATRGEVAQGPFADRFPDLFGVPRRPGGYAYVFARTDPRRAAWFGRLGTEEHLGVKGRSMNGSHREEGIAVLAGPFVRSGCALTGANARDVTPTLLALAGLPLREGMDGRPWTEAFSDVARAVRVEPDPEDGDAPPASAADRDAQVARRLRSLGYL